MNLQWKKKMKIKMRFQKGIISAFAKANICNKIVPKCSFMSPDIFNFYAFKMIKSYLDLFWQVQSRSLSCLNNIVLSYPSTELGDLDGLWKIVIELTHKSFNVTVDYKEYCSAKIAGDLQNLTTSILYSILKKSNNITATEAHVSWLLEKLQTEDEHIRVNIIGTLGLLCKTPIGPVIVDRVTASIVKSLEDPSLWVITESLDIIFSVYDDLFDDMFKKISVCKVIKSNQSFSERKDPIMQKGRYLKRSYYRSTRKYP